MCIPTCIQQISCVNDETGNTMRACTWDALAYRSRSLYSAFMVGVVEDGAEVVV